MTLGLLCVSLLGLLWPTMLYPLILQLFSKIVWATSSSESAPLAVIIPCYNESRAIFDKIQSVAHQLRPGQDIIVVIDDGSTDNTLAEARRASHDINLTVSILAAGRIGKAQALTLAIASCTQPLIVVTDANSTIAPKALSALVLPFQDAQVGAVRGSYQIQTQSPNGLGQMAGRYQQREHRRFCNESIRGMLMTSGGTLQAFRRSLISFETKYTMTEDWDMTLTVREQGFYVVYSDQAISMKKVTDRPDDLVRQNVRLVYGTIQTSFKHLFRPKLWLKARVLLAFLGGKFGQVVTTLWLAIGGYCIIALSFQGQLWTFIILLCIICLLLAVFTLIIIDPAGKQSWPLFIRATQYLVLLQVSSVVAWCLYIVRGGRSWSGWTPIQSVRL